MIGRTWLGAALCVTSIPALTLTATPAFAQLQQQTVAEPTLQLSGNIRGVRSEATTGDLLAIEVLDIRVRVRGHVTETQITATFRNPRSDILEGDFRFDMPAGSVITGYALDVGPNLIDGVLAGRDQAREAYQRRVAVRVDPGLAEVTWNDRFTTRIFPIPAGGSRTIRLTMTSPLTRNAYVLPMRPSGPVGRFTLAIEADDGTPPSVTLPDGVTGTWDGGRFTLDRWDARLGGELRLGAPAATDQLQLSRHANGDIFFELAGRNYRVGAVAGPSPTPPLHIFWDRSVSRRDDDHEAELAFLEALSPIYSRNDAADLTLFDSSGAQTVRVTSRAELAAAIRGVRYGGATSYASLSAVPVDGARLCIMVTDGRVTLDGRVGLQLPCQMHMVSSDREVDRGWMAAMAERHGGRHIELGAGTSPADAASAANATRGSAGRWVDDAGNPIEVVRIDGGSGRERFVGRMPDQGGIRRVYGAGAERRYERPTTPVPLFSGPGALWASRIINAQASDMRTADVVAMARRFSVASPYASFIVLENPADYVEANIPPPASYPKALFDQYAMMRANADQAIAARQAGRLTEVAALWDERVAWWERRFDAPTVRDEQSNSRRRAGSPRNNGPVDMLPSPPPPSPPPPPPPPPAVVNAPPALPPNNAEQEDGGSEERIVVTATRRRAERDADAANPVTVVATEQLAGELRSQPEGDIANSNDAEAAATTAPTVALPDWSSSRSWIAALDAAGDNWAAAFDREMAVNGALPLFWFDVAEWHFRKGRGAEARRMVESALDLPSRDNQTLSIVAARLQRYGDLDRAIALVEQLVDRENERPQPLRTLAVLLMQRAEAHRTAGRNAAARTDLERAIALLADAVLTVRREQYHGFEQTALMDANLAVQRFRALGGRDHALPARLVGMLDADIRVVIEWNTPRTDMDLHLDEPGGFEVYFASRLSPHGGSLTADVTNGYGPEEYMIRRAPAGEYVVRTNSFSEDRTNPNGPTTIAARIIRNFGRPDQSEQLVDVEMDPSAAGRMLIGRVRVAQPPAR